MTVATIVMATASLGLLAACTGDDDPASEPTSTVSNTPPQGDDASPTPSVDPSTDGAIALRGDWEAPEADWIVHFEEDGTFTEDFQGQPDFRVGKYEVTGKTVKLIGDDGNTTAGKIAGSGDTTTLTFKLGTLKRQ